MKKKFVLFTGFLACLFLAAFSTMQEKKVFPDLSGETLEDKPVHIPADLKGKFSIIGLAYSDKAEKDLRTWLNPIYNKFVEKSSMFNYDVNLYFIPMFTGARQASMNYAKKELKEGTTKQFFSNILCYRGELKKYKDELQMKEKDKPYFFVLDKEGKIIYATSGNCTDSKMEEMESKLVE